MYQKQENGILYSKMFGVFGLTWNNGQMTGTGKSSESQFAYLMQALLHYRENGVSRDHLEQIVFGERDIVNVHHALQSVIYNAKRKLKESGLPDVNYIEQRNGLYYWTPEIPVIEDAAEFEQVYSKAEEETDPDKKLSLYLDACYRYTGEFLAAQATMIWVALEAKRYCAMFRDCVEKACRLLREKKDFRRLEQLGIYATKVEPLEDWPAVTMEALLATGQYGEARQLYNTVSENATRGQNVRPPQRLLEQMEQMVKQFDHQHRSLDGIQKSLSSGKPPLGGYMCAYPVFRSIYQLLERAVQEDKWSSYLMLCTIIDSNGRPMRECTMLDKLATRLVRAINYAVRKQDIVCRYGRGQYLVMLPHTNLEECKRVQKQIDSHFLEGRQRTAVRYHINRIIGIGEKAGAELSLAAE